MVVLLIILCTFDFQMLRVHSRCTCFFRHDSRSSEINCLLQCKAHKKLFYLNILNESKIKSICKFSKEMLLKTWVSFICYAVFYLFLWSTVHQQSFWTAIHFLKNISFAIKHLIDALDISGKFQSVMIRSITHFSMNNKSSNKYVIWI